MAKIFISHRDKEGKCRELAENFDRFLQEVLGLKNEDVFLSSRSDSIQIGTRFNDEILKEMDQADVIIFLITKEFTESVACLAEVGAAYALERGSKSLFPLLESSVGEDFINKTPLIGLEYKHYEEKGTLKHIGRVLYDIGIISRSPDEFSDDLDSFCEATEWGKYVAPGSVSASSQAKNLDSYIRKLEGRSDKSDEARYLLSEVLSSDVITSGSKKNREDSLDLLTKASGDKYPWAELKIADMTLNGDLMRTGLDFETEFELISDAAESKTECAPAWVAYGWMLCLGIGCERDLDKAERFCNRVPDGFGGKKYNLVAAISRIRNNKKDELPSSGKYDGEAQILYEAAEMYLLGGCDYLPDFQCAMSYYNAATKAGVVRAEVRLGDLYYYGLVDSDPSSKTRLDPKPNYEKAAEHFRVAADAGDVYSQTMLGSLYRRGLGVAKDWKAAVRWFAAAADRGYAPAQYELGILQGRKGYKSGWQKAQILLLNASCQDNSDAQCLMGDVYRFGLLNCERNLNEAAKLYQKASEQGNHVAELRLKDLHLK